MADLAHGTQPEFWRPPVLPTDALVVESVPSMAESCSRCGREFLLGAGFCHSCGGRRSPAMSASARADAAAIAGLWERGIHQIQYLVSGLSWSKLRFPAWLRHLHFHEIKRWVGLSTGSLIAFFIGLACVTGALLVGLLTAKTFVDWQAIQFYRAEWLLGATVAFVGGILLKKPSVENDE